MWECGTGSGYQDILIKPLRYSTGKKKTTISFKIILAAALSNVCLGVEFQILNREIQDIWVGIQGNPEHVHLHEGGFVLKPGKNVSIHAPTNWAGRFWARTWCNPKNNHCDTGDCGNKLKCNGNGGEFPASLVEITLKGYNGLDYYDVSLIGGFNIMVAIEPLEGKGDNSSYSCKVSACQVPLNDVCAEKLKIRNSHGVVACKSACYAFNTDQHCCRGAFSDPRKCQLSTWPENYPHFFKSRCPDAYSFAYDDSKSGFTCMAEAYLITFGR